MPTYLTPGVYVEEVPSANKPIEGVSTSIAAFVGLAPGGPVNTPMRISNWTQFAKIFGDPNEPDNGPFMEGAYLAHASTASSRTAAACAGSSASATTAAPTAPAPRRARRCRRRPTPPSRPSRAVALEAGTDDVKVEIVRGAGAPARAPTRPTRSRSTAGADKRGVHRPDAQEGPQQPRHQGQRASKLIKIEETGASLPEAQRVPATGTLHAVGRRRSTRPRSSRRTSRATSPAARAWAAWPPSTRSRWS